MTLLNKITQAIEPIVAKHGQELVEVTFEENSQDKKLKVIVGSMKGTGIKELTSKTNAFNALNEDGSIIPFDFSLDVSSPGLDRPLKTSSDFKRNVDRDVSIKHKGDNDTTHNDTGTIKEVSETDVVINVTISNKKNENKKIQLENIIVAKLVIKIGKRK
jgi:ribosome maturation factor RimP